MSKYNPESSALQLFSRALAIKYRVIPLRIANDELHMLSPRPLSANDLADLMFVTGHIITQIPIAADELSRLIDTHYPSAAPTIESVFREGPQFEYRSDSGSQGAEAGGITNQVDAIISRAVQMRSSDVHLEPTDQGLTIRYRIDGVLQTMQPLARDEQPQIISRIKLMAGMDIAERRKPQDGRITMKSHNALLDIRVSSVPTRGSERLVLRLLNVAEQVLSVHQLGMPAEQLELFRRHLERPQGMILVTGPTGSGKTTTLYSALAHLARPGVNIMTIEDPIEYELPGITQSQVKPEIGYDFANALRAFLRQDPDIIMVGEIRDLETAQAALRAALTGHLVLSTVHTNTAAATVTRLTDLGVESYLVASSVSLIVAQRLMRKLCRSCRILDTGAEQSLRTISGVALACHGPIFKAGRGCGHCSSTGYHGRLGIFELLPVANLDRDLYLCDGNKPSAMLIGDRTAVPSLRDAAVAAVLSGQSSIAELARILS